MWQADKSESAICLSTSVEKVPGCGYASCMGRYAQLAKAAVCKTVTTETSLVRFQPGPPEVLIEYPITIYSVTQLPPTVDKDVRGQVARKVLGSR